MFRELESAFLLALAAGCEAPMAVPPRLTEVTVVAPGEPAERSEPELRSAITAPSQVPYRPEALGAGEEFVTVTLTNAGSGTLEIGSLEVAFTATRDGVPFPCNTTRAAGLREREPSRLEPGESQPFERRLDCEMPLPGLYTIGVSIRMSAEPDAKPRGIGSFSLDVIGRGTVPKPYPPRPGLWVMMTGNRDAPPMPPAAWARGDYHVLVAVVNGSSQRVQVGPGHLSLMTYRRGSAIPCSGETQVLALPAYLEPGRTAVVPAPVSCSPSEEGQYELEGLFNLDKDEPPLTIGGVPLKVSTEPPPLVPVPLDSRWQ